MNLDAIKAGINNSTTILWPGTQTQVKVRILAKADLQAATFAARRLFLDKSMPVDTVTIEAFKDEETIQVLYRALQDAEAPKPLSPTIDLFRASVSTDELSELSRAYQAFEMEVSPCPDLMGEEEFAKFREVLKKKPDEIVGCVSSIAFARRLLRSLVDPPPS